MTVIRSILYADSPNLDAFARLRISDPVTIFDSKLIVDAKPLIWDDQQTSGAGTSSTHNTNQASVTMSVSTSTAGTRVRQTFRRFNYQPGKSFLFIQTGVFGAGAAGIKRRAGLFDASNGIFFEQDSTGMNVVIRTFTSGSAVDAAVPQSSWNIDKMNGTGASGINLDFTKAQIWFADFEWLGVGRVRFGWFVNGVPYYCHQVLNANNISLVYMSTPNLPLRYEIVNDGTGAASGFTQICSTCIIEGGRQDTGFPFGVNRGTTPLVTNNNASIYPLIAVRLKSTYLGSLISNINFSVNCISTASYNIYVLLNPTVTGTALAFTGVTNSSVEADVVSTNATTLSNGTTLFSTTMQQQTESGAMQGIEGDFRLGSTISGTADILVLAVQRITGTSETFYGSFNWRDTQ